MAIRTRIEPIDRNVVLAIRQGEDPKERSRKLASFAQIHLAEAQEQNRKVLGFIPPHETYVDGRRSAAMETVKPDGVIVSEFEILADMFGYIDLLLIKHSPVKSGRYRRSHILLADGVEVDPSAPILTDASEYVYLSTQPYARKIEKGLSSQAPEGVYEAVAVLAAKRFGNLVKIRFSYRSLVGGSVGDWAGKTKMKTKSRKGAARRDWLTRQPAIVITR